MSVCICRRVCVNVHYNVHQHVEYIYVYIWPHIQKHTTESFIQRIKHSILMSMDSGNSNNYKNRAVDFHNFDWHNILPEPQKTSMCLFSRTRFALKVAFNMFKRLYMALIAGIFIIVLTNRKVHLPDNNGMLSADALLIHAVTTVYFQYPTRREHWPQYPSVFMWKFCMYDDLSRIHNLRFTIT